MTTVPTFIRALAALMDEGLPCFPCHADKTPATPSGYKKATTDRKAVAELWRRCPAALIGVPTGENSGLDVLDIDPRHGGDRWFSEHKARLTLRHRTFEDFVIQWLNQHPSPSAPGHCAWCGSPESPSARVVPFGTEPWTHTWLHPECWPDWHRARRIEATTALAAMGIAPAVGGKHPNAGAAIGPMLSGLEGPPVS
jgi:hypothetical protein